jgi:hypothetical protein
MADFLSRWNIPERYGQLKKRLKDMGDGTYAEVVAADITNTAASGVYVRPGTSATWAISSVAIPTTIYHGQKTVTTAGTEVALAASQAILSGVRIKALAANTGIIYVGANPVTSTTGFALAAGEEVFVEVANLATVYIDSSVNGEGVSYIAS